MVSAVLFRVWLFSPFVKVYASHKCIISHLCWVRFAILSIVPNNYQECLFGFFVPQGGDTYSHALLARN